MFVIFWNYICLLNCVRKKWQHFKIWQWSTLAICFLCLLHLHQCEEGTMPEKPQALWYLSAVWNVPELLSNVTLTRYFLHPRASLWILVLTCSKSKTYLVFWRRLCTISAFGCEEPSTCTCIHIGLLASESLPCSSVSQWDAIQVALF